MNLNDKIQAKFAELTELKAKVEAGDADAKAKAEALITEIETLKAQAETAKKAANVLATIGQKSTTGAKSAMDEFTEKAANMADRKTGVRMSLKAATDVVSAPQIADIDRSVAPQPTRRAVADFFTNATISGNAITYFLQGDYEGTPAATAQGAKKSQNSTSFEAVTLPLTKIAAYIKETDEILADAPFLASEVRNSLIYQVGKVEDAAVVSAVAGTSGIGAAEYDADNDETLADGILQAILNVKGNSAYEASIVLVNPADLYALMSAKDANKQYIGGGYFTGAYGNGSYSVPSTIWGVPVVADSGITSGEALVAAREAVKVWRKGTGVDVRLFEQNEDDAIHNRVTLVGEERLTCAVTDLKGVVAVAAKE